MNAIMKGSKTSYWTLMSLILAFSVSMTSAGVMYDGFISEVVTSTKGMSGTFLPNPRNGNKPMLILNAKNGQINVLEDPDESPDAIEIMDLSDGPKVCNNGERGLHTVIPSPNFAENRHLFAFFTKHREDCLEDAESGPHNVVVRFTMDAETLMLDYDEGTLIFQGPPMDKRLHNGGAMAFGNDGKLYITTGDAGIRAYADPLDNVHGSIIRLNEDGSVPDDNPFTKASGYENSYRCADTEGRVPKDAPPNSVCAEVWANGLRNPFRIDMDPSVTDKVKFSFGVVGAQHIEAIYYGGTDYKGTNYGWPKYEGVCRPGDMEDCNPRDDNPALTMPFHWYEHISYNDGGCIGGQVHVPEGIWPPEFKYLFIDFILLKIYSLELDRPDQACWECDPPLPPTHNTTFYDSVRKEGDNINEARMVEMWFGPYKDTQALYVTKFGNHDTLIRIRYTGILNKPPVPAFDFHSDGDSLVAFDATRTSDAENDELTYRWDFGDESEIVADATNVSHEYGGPGEYVVTLEVTDSSGQEQQVSKLVKVGKPPIVSILSPTPNTTFSVGQILRLAGEAVDFSGKPIPDDRLTWEVRQHHAQHFHPFLDLTSGNDFDLYKAPEPEDFFAATNSFLKVILTAEDDFGLTETVSVDVQPHVIMVNVTTQPEGLNVIVDGYDVGSSQLITSWRGYRLPVEAPDQPPYLFKKWSDDRKAPKRKFDIYHNEGDPLPEVRAIYCLDYGTECENHSDCCSGYCSEGMNFTCASAPITDSPIPSTFLRPTSSDLDVDIFFGKNNDEGRPLMELGHKKPIFDKVTSSDVESNEGDQRQSNILTIAITASLLAIINGCCLLRHFIIKKKTEERAALMPTVHKDHYSDYDSGSNTGMEDSSDDGDIKDMGTGSTEESDAQDQHENQRINLKPETDPSQDLEHGCSGVASASGSVEEAKFEHDKCINVSTDNSNVSLSFLLVDDIESQNSNVQNDRFSNSSSHSLQIAPSLSAVSESERSNDEPEVEESHGHPIQTVDDTTSLPAPFSQTPSGPNTGLCNQSPTINGEVNGSFRLRVETIENETNLAVGGSEALDPRLVDSSVVEDEFMDDSTHESDKETDVPSKEVVEANRSLALTEDTDLRSLHSTHLIQESPMEDASILSESMNGRTVGETNSTLPENSQVVIATVSHDLSPLKSPTLQGPLDSTFFSPEAQQQKATTETPETLLLSYEDADSSIEHSVSVRMEDCESISPNIAVPVESWLVD